MVKHEKSSRHSPVPRSGKAVKAGKQVFPLAIVTCVVCHQPADGLVNGECSRCRTRGKFTGTVELEDHGQDFLRWQIVDGVVVSSEPFQDWVWKGTLVHNAVIGPGDILLISPPKGDRTILKYPVVAVK